MRVAAAKVVNFAVLCVVALIVYIIDYNVLIYYYLRKYYC